MLMKWTESSPFTWEYNCNLISANTKALKNDYKMKCRENPYRRDTRKTNGNDGRKGQRYERQPNLLNVDKICRAKIIWKLLVNLGGSNNRKCNDFNTDFHVQKIFFNASLLIHKRKNFLSAWLVQWLYI